MDFGVSQWDGVTPLPLFYPISWKLCNSQPSAVSLSGGKEPH